MNSTFRALFLFTSFGPLYLIVGAKLWLDHNTGPAAWWVFFAAALATVPAFLLIRARLKSDNPTRFEITDVKARDAEIFSYITTYIPPLISRDLSEPAAWIPLAILYTVIVAAYMRIDSPYLNPYFLLCGYRLYEARLLPSRNLATIVAIGRRISSGEDVMLDEIGTGDLYACHDDRNE